MAKTGSEAKVGRKTKNGTLVREEKEKEGKGREGVYHQPAGDEGQWGVLARLLAKAPTPFIKWSMSSGLPICSGTSGERMGHGVAMGMLLLLVAMHRHLLFTEHLVYTEYHQIP